MCYPYLNKDSFECMWPTDGYHTLQPYATVVKVLLRYLAMSLTDIQPLFICLGLAVLQKHLTGDYHHVWTGWLHLCVMGTWVPSWGDVILIWYHYIVICAFVTIFNWQLSIKGMKLWLLIKEALVVIYWLTLCIILLCSLASWHQALLLEKRLHKALGQPVICNSRYYTENLHKSTCAINVYWFLILDLFLNIIFSWSRKKLNHKNFYDTGIVTSDWKVVYTTSLWKVCKWQQGRLCRKYLTQFQMFPLQNFSQTYGTCKTPVIQVL